MDDDKINTDQNQSKTIFETVPEEETPTQAPEALQPEEQLQPEEVAPELVMPEEISTSQPPTEGPPPEPPMISEGGKSRYFIIGGAVILFLIIFILIFRFFFAGKSQKKEIKLSYWGLWEEKEILQPIIDEYQAQNKGVKIDYQKMTPQDYREKLIARSKNKEGPDIFRFHNTWIPELKEVISPLPESIISNEEFEKTFYSVYKNDLKVENNYYGLPLMIDGLVLVYNQTLFKQAGISTPPVSWEDIIDYVAKLTVKNKEGQIITSGIALGTASNVDHFSDIFGLFLAQNGIRSIKDLDQPEAAGALESYRKFSEPPDNFWDETLPNSTTAFIQEKVAMIIVPSWVILTIKASNPEINLKVVSVPEIPGSKPVSLASYWVEGVSKYSNNQIEAWKFLKFLSQKDTLAKLYQLESTSRLFGEPYSRVDLKDTLSQNEYIGAVIKQADSFISMPVISRTYDNGLNDGINKYLENAINSTVNGESYDSALKTAKKGVDQILSLYEIAN